MRRIVLKLILYTFLFRKCFTLIIRNFDKICLSEDCEFASILIETVDSNFLRFDLRRNRMPFYGSNSHFYIGLLDERRQNWAALKISSLNKITGIFVYQSKLNEIKYDFKNNSHFIVQYNTVEFGNLTNDINRYLVDQPIIFMNTTNKTRTSVHNRSKRSIIKGISATLSSDYFIEVLLINDEKFSKSYSNAELLLDANLQVINYLNGFLLDLNVTVVMTGKIDFVNGNPFTISANKNQTQTNLKKYIQNNLQKFHSQNFHFDNIHLLTRIHLGNDTLGYAYVGAICIPVESFLVVIAFAESLLLTANIMAHELGHNLGMLHDEPQCQCIPSKKCIMSSTTGSSLTTQWSDCSLNYMQNLNPQQSQCILNKPTFSIKQSCGNGLIEDDEECDSKESFCCDQKTCKLSPGSQCATGLCCDISNCTFHSSGVLCRGKDNSNECDLDDTCDGQNEFCLQSFAPNGQYCSSSSGYCYNGSCKSHMIDCEKIIGQAVKRVNSACFQNNANGTANGHCGRITVSKFIACDRSNVECGLLQCDKYKSSKPNEYTYFGSLVTLTTKVARGRQFLYQCMSFIYNNEYVMVSDGTPCNSGRGICIKQKCVPNSQLKKCSQDCSQYKRNCNHLGNCIALPTNQKVTSRIKIRQTVTILRNNSTFFPEFDVNFDFLNTIPIADNGNIQSVLLTFILTLLLILFLCLICFILFSIANLLLK